MCCECTVRSIASFRLKRLVRGAREKKRPIDLASARSLCIPPDIRRQCRVKVCLASYGGIKILKRLKSMIFQAQKGVAARWHANARARARHSALLAAGCSAFISFALCFTLKHPRTRSTYFDFAWLISIITRPLAKLFLLTRTHFSCVYISIMECFTSLVN